MSVFQPKENAKGYRHELKYLISEKDAALLSIRLRSALKTDPHAKDGGYFIRSLYFEDPFNTAVSEKVEGIEYRDKWRIRIYNLSDRSIKLERKHKNGQFIKKDSLTLSKSECKALCAGSYGFLLHRPEPFAKEAYGEMVTKHLMPKVIVDYEREPFVFPVQDVRITLDRNIRTGLYATDLFNKHMITYPATAFEGQCILEVKFNGYLESYVMELLQLNAAQHTAASKYLYCRQYDC